MKNKNELKTNMIFIFIIVILFIFLVNSTLNSERDDNEKKSETTSNIGRKYELYNGGSSIPVASNLESFKKMIDSSVSNDIIGYTNLKSSGQLFNVESGTDVLILDSKINKRQVRILEGKYYGKSGWVPYEWVR